MSDEVGGGSDISEDVEPTTRPAVVLGSPRSIKVRARRRGNNTRRGDNDRSAGQDPQWQLTVSSSAHPDRVRLWLARGMLIILGLFAMGAIAGWLAGADGEHMRDLVVVLSPFMTLAGAVFGFYFTTAKKKRR